MSKQPTLVSPKEYIKQATKLANRAKHTISLITMIVVDDSQTNDFLLSLGNAAKRGVRVEIAADTVTFGNISGHLKPHRYYTKKARDTRKMIDYLKKQGVHFTWVGNFSVFAFASRNHMKCLVIDDIIFSFGGVNIDEESLSFSDYMFRLQDERLALELRSDIARIVAADKHNFAYRSHEFHYNAKSKILIDGGFFGDSIIYRRACEITKNAKEVVLVSQYCPVSKLSRLLKKTHSKLYFNTPIIANNTSNKMIIRYNMAVSGHSSLYKGSRYIHAKFLIATNHDGSKVALTGSHNFTYTGVIAGTREIALETTEIQIISQLEDFLEKKIAKPSR